MPKRAATLPLALPPREPGTPAHRWLYGALRTEILEGRLRPGTRLPATRDLAVQHALSRGTVVSAFEQLKAEGYVEGSVGSGTYVTRVLPEELLHASRPARGRAASQRCGRRPLSALAQRARLFPAYDARPTRAFRANLPALDLFPTTLWAQLAARRVRGATTRLLMGCDPMGWRPLRDAVAGYLTTARGVACAPEQVAIVSGVQEALDIAARLLLDPGDTVCMEDPGYPGAALAFEACGARVRTAPPDDAGLRLDAPFLRGARLAYVTPAHQFPLGIAMPLSRRLALLEWARGAGAMIFEDDYDSEYRYAGRPLPALQGLDRDGVVLFAGSFSKVLFPSLRLGYLVVPPDLVDPIAALKSLTSRHAPLLEQAVLHDFIVEGHFARHVRRMREVYAERLAVLLECGRECLTGLLEITGVEAGLQTAGWLAGGIAEDEAVAAAAARDVDVTPLGEYGRSAGARAGLQLGFAAVDAPEIRRGARELAAALEPLARARRNITRASRSPRTP
ncbi:MAG TPA: PLP-dependent aminotransferase family protein [Gemmatimonadaceae bacterium]|nr:PLP-dependent aminotransferase family protein [Gemmatimonadaceae bacterium]